MIQIKSILCPLDLSETSSGAYDYATMLARWYGASLTVIEMIWVGLPVVRPSTAPLIVPSDLLEQYGAELQQFVKDRPKPDVSVTTVLREGPMVDGILDQARQQSADLIVMGTHGRGGFQRLILGSVTEKILRKAACPVLTVPPRSAAAPAANFKTIVCPIDFSPSSLRALTYALSLAQESGGSLILVHVFDWPADRPMTPGLGPEMSAARRKDEDDARRELRASVPDKVREWCNCQELTAIGKPYDEILRVAAERHADLIVMGVHGRNAVELALFGSTTNQVVRRATCPVLTIRAGVTS